jgi:hypothetical protein
VTSVAIADMAFTVSSQRLLFAGRPVLFNTHSPKIARYAGEFFSQQDPAESGPSENGVIITIHVRESHEPPERSPWFRARGHFAVARFTRADSFWFNLRTREVCGVCSPALADDPWCWRAHIFPALVGILSAVMRVAPVHAACLVRNGRGTLFAGHSGAGKSTLAIALAKRGHALLSDEWAYLSATPLGVAAWGLPVPVKLLPDATRFFPELLVYRPANSLNSETAYEVLPDECFGVLRQMHCFLNAIVLLERTAALRCEIAPISAIEAVEHLAMQVEPLEGSLAPYYEGQCDLIRTLVDTQCLRVSFNDHPHNVAEAIDAALARMQ